MDRKLVPESAVSFHIDIWDPECDGMEVSVGRSSTEVTVFLKFSVFLYDMLGPCEKDCIRIDRRVRTEWSTTDANAIRCLCKKCADDNRGETVFSFCESSVTATEGRSC